MANIKSAKKRAEIAERNRQRNVAIKSSVKTAIRKVLETVKENNTEKLVAALNKAYSVIDKAVIKGVLHRNTGARKKSRLTRHVNKQEVPATE
ncbi:MAG: 30S ribosomal protein S20 [Candidatus Melainabacteria bacterium RIFOXYA12_FULL_32_12]|nr:MAG: 30S ribosomal protein S20 [Candidatus Melainabacteria bacterium GWF2_32_7]OGI17760.1 MAG: 30S ribosomal protein S20 [Candidatus Melainabacteria bacterium RIFOXYA2_FULL_32_9]OGI24613.1 MAG: 30S ribosomal protein S20 [Candidatus Melainabacteria bacterium RIFOXYA12_FULL_32_12]